MKIAVDSSAEGPAIACLEVLRYRFFLPFVFAGAFTVIDHSVELAESGDHLVMHLGPRRQATLQVPIEQLPGLRLIQSREEVTLEGAAGRRPLFSGLAFDRRRVNLMLHCQDAIHLRFDADALK